MVNWAERKPMDETIRERIKYPWKRLMEALFSTEHYIPADDSEALVRALNEHCDNGLVDGQIRTLIRVNALRHGYISRDEHDSAVSEAVREERKRVGLLEAYIHRLAYAGDQFLALDPINKGDAETLWCQMKEKWHEQRQEATEAAIRKEPNYD